MAAGKIRTLVIDDSIVIQKFLTQLIETSDNIEVMGTAADPFQAAKIIEREIPDVITLDIEMPKMDGITFLRKIMAQYPLPVIIISSKARSSTPLAVEALDLGAFAIFPKSNLDLNNLELSAQRLIETIQKAADYRPKRIRNQRTLYRPTKANPPVTPTRTVPNTASRSILAIGASTGGTEAIRAILEHLPANSPGTVIVIHMPENFTAAYANRLDQQCEMHVKEAEDGDLISEGTALVAKGGHHLSVYQRGAEFRVRVEKTAPVNRHMPSVDVLFNSVAKVCKKNALGVILTGMGGDGAKGLKEMRDVGSFTIAQDEKSSVVFGMPRVAIELGAAAKVLHLRDIAASIRQYFQQSVR